MTDFISTIGVSVSNEILKLNKSISYCENELLSLDSLVSKIKNPLKIVSAGLLFGGLVYSGSGSEHYVNSVVSNCIGLSVLPIGVLGMLNIYALEESEHVAKLKDRRDYLLSSLVR